MTTMIERVARAIAASVYSEAGVELMWKCYMDKARAAIEAMREPTAGMVSSVTIDHIEDVEEFWGALIDAALKEE